MCDVFLVGVQTLFKHILPLKLTLLIISLIKLCKTKKKKHFTRDEESIILLHTYEVLIL